MSRFAKRQPSFCCRQEVVLETHLPRQIVHWTPRATANETCQLIAEEPLSIRVQGKPYAVVMRTPGDEIAHVAGFCLSEGIIDACDDLNAIGFCDGADTNVVTVTLSAVRRQQIDPILERRGFISQTSCGLCGKELVKDLTQAIPPLPRGTTFDRPQAVRLIEMLADHQPLRRLTRASHAAAVYTAERQLLSVAEDVGRHNAVDKAIGRVLLDHRIDRAAVLVLSSRISYELVQKAARAGIPTVLSVSRPTRLAVNLGAHLNMTLACLSRDDGLYIFCGRHRLA